VHCYHFGVLVTVAPVTETRGGCGRRHGSRRGRRNRTSARPTGGEMDRCVPEPRQVTSPSSVESRGRDRAAAADCAYHGVSEVRRQERGPVRRGTGLGTDSEACQPSPRVATVRLLEASCDHLGWTPHHCIVVCNRISWRDDVKSSRPCDVCSDTPATDRSRVAVPVTGRGPGRRAPTRRPTRVDAPTVSLWFGRTVLVCLGQWTRRR
jgi:hypothetical protein